MASSLKPQMDICLSVLLRGKVSVPERIERMKKLHTRRDLHRPPCSIVLVAILPMIYLFLQPIKQVLIDFA